MLALKPFELFLVMTPDVADGDPAVLRALVDDLHELLAALFGEGREAQPDHVPVVRGGDPQVTRLDRLLDRGDRVLVERLNEELPRLGDAERRELVQRNRRSVVIRGDPVQERRRRTAGAD